MDPIYRQLVQLLDDNQPFAFAVLIETEGSTPQKCGAKAIFLPDGRILGTLGGGCLEAETRQKALRALQTGESLTFRAVLDDDFGWDDGLICGGAVQTFVEPNPGSREVWRRLLDDADARRRRMLVTVTGGEHAGARVLVSVGGRRAEPARPTNSTVMAADPVSPEVLDEICRRSAELLSEPEPEPSSLILHPAGSGASPSSLSVYIEPILPNPTLVVCGGGHVGCAIGKLAAWCGFDVVAIDDRGSFANKERFPDAQTIIVDDPAKVMKDFPIDEDTCVCIVTRGHRHDAAVLREVIHSKAAYIGMIGSKRKVRTIMEGFIEEGIATVEEFRRIHSPMGLAIRSITVEEIAVSAVAELIAVRRGRNVVGSLSVTPGLAETLEGRGAPTPLEGAAPAAPNA